MRFSHQFVLREYKVLPAYAWLCGIYVSAFCCCFPGRLCTQQTECKRGASPCAPCKVSARAKPSTHCRMMSDWNVELVNDNVNEFYVQFKGPPDSAPWP